MIRLLNVELKKVQNYKAAWVFVGLYLVLLPLFFNIFKGGNTEGISFDEKAIYSFPEVWGYLAYIASFFHILPGFLIIMLVANEYTYRTFRQHVIDGYSRLELLGGKLLLIVLMSVVLALYVFALGLYFGVANTTELTMEAAIKKLYLIPVFALQTLGYLSLALIIGMLVKRAALAIILYLLYILLIERLIGAKLPDEVSQFFPANVFSDLISFPMKMLLMMTGISVKELSLTVSILVTGMYILLFSGLSYLLLKKRDL